MKKILISLFVISMLAVSVGFVIADKPTECTRIQDGVLTYSAGHYLAGQPLMIGYDPYGYNYQAHMFSGSYANSYLGKDEFLPYEGNDEAYLAENPGAEDTWYWPYRDVGLMMKWSDEWLSNKDCNEDGKLDRGYSCTPENPTNSACEGAWVTNHQFGSDEDEETEKTCYWDYFVKIVHPGDDAELIGGMWYTADDVEIGPVIWGSFARIQQIYNDPCAGDHGVEYLSAASAGFGFYT